jgi:hypothetical protein
MRTVIAGDGSDSTAAVQAHLAAHNSLLFADLYLIGNQEFPDSIWLTNWDSPLTWPYLPNPFLPAVVNRTGMTVKVGLEVTSLNVEWAPKNRVFSATSNPTGQTSPLQLAQLGYYDNWDVRVWRALMPTPGDANTFGAMPWFGGRISSTKVGRDKIVWTVNSFLEVIDQYVPGNVIENSNTRAGYIGSTPLPGDTVLAQFAVHSGSTEQVIVGRCTSPSSGHVYTAHSMQGGYLVFLGGTGATLGGFYSVIADNTTINLGGTNYNNIQVFTPFPWAPDPTHDTFYVSRHSPVDMADGTFYGFPYVPAPEDAASGT